MSTKPRTSVTLVGAGTIGLSFAALYLAQNSNFRVTICDIRPDLEAYVLSSLQGLLDEDGMRDLMTSSCLTLQSDLAKAVAEADIVQEQGPENASFKQGLWPTVEKHASPSCLFWSSTSGIPASKQSELMISKSRLLVVHPYNPPHKMPLIEVVPSPETSQQVIDETLRFWKSLNRSPVVVKKETTGFVANRLAFALLREACYLVNEDVVDVAGLDSIVEASMGPRWAKAGPFKSYNVGGGTTGFRGLMDNIGATVQACWDDAGHVNMGDAWQSKVSQQIEETYGVGAPKYE